MHNGEDPWSQRLNATHTTIDPYEPDQAAVDEMDKFIETWVSDKVVEKGSWYRFDADGFLFRADEGEEGAWKAAWDGYVEGTSPQTAEIKRQCTCGAKAVKDPFHYAWCDLEEIQ